MNGVFMSNGIILLNLCGDVIYIIQQRLKAQNIDNEKGSVVLNDLILTIYAHPFLNKIFSSAKTFTYQEVFKLIDQVVHCSIMKLNEDSLQKLYDLVIMTLKSYLMKSNSPYEIYLCTLNHFDTILQIGLFDSAKQAIQQCRQQFIDKYQKLSSFDYILIRGEVLRFLQGRFTRVQMFLNDKSQNTDGTFVQKLNGVSGYGVEKPGQIFKTQTKDKYNVILISASFYQQNQETSPFSGKSSLGENIFASKEIQNSTQAQSQIQQNSQISQQYNPTYSKQCAKELTHLAQLIQVQPLSNTDDINLFYKPTVINQEQPQQNDEQNKKQQQQQQQQKESQIIKQQILQQFEADSQLIQFDDKENEEELDLLDLMDKAGMK